MQIAVVQRLGEMAAHGHGDRASLEVVLRLWCRRQPGLRGGGVALLAHFYEQSMQRERERCDAAAWRIERAVWPMFRDLAEDAAAREAISQAAQHANDGELEPDEVDAMLSDVLQRVRAWRRRHRRTA